MLETQRRTKGAKKWPFGIHSNPMGTTEWTRTDQLKKKVRGEGRSGEFGEWAATENNAKKCGFASIETLILGADAQSFLWNKKLVIWELRTPKKRPKYSRIRPQSWKHGIFFIKMLLLCEGRLSKQRMESAYSEMEHIVVHLTKTIADCNEKRLGQIQRTPNCFLIKKNWALNYVYLFLEKKNHNKQHKAKTKIFLIYMFM